MSNQIIYPNCSIIFLHVFLPQFFKNLDLLEGQKFINKAAKIKAVQLLLYLSTSTDHFVKQSELTIFKILVDIPKENKIKFSEKLTVVEILECENLLNAFIAHWSVLKNINITGVQDAFLQRNGLIFKLENMIEIHLEQKVIDILLSELPYSFSNVKLPWLKNILTVNI